MSDGVFAPDTAHPRTGPVALSGTTAGGVPARRRVIDRDTIQGPLAPPSGWLRPRLAVLDHVGGEGGRGGVRHEDPAERPRRRHGPEVGAPAVAVERAANVAARGAVEE